MLPNLPFENMLGSMISRRLLTLTSAWLMISFRSLLVTWIAFECTSEAIQATKITVNIVFIITFEKQFSCFDDEIFPTTIWEWSEREREHFDPTPSTNL